MDVLAPLFRMQQYPFDDARLDIMGAQVFDRAHGVEGGLDNNAPFHDGAAAFVAALLSLLHMLKLPGE